MAINVDLSGLEKALKSIGGKKAEIGSIRRRTKIAGPIESKIIEDGSVVLIGDELIKHLDASTGLLAIGNTQITLHIYDPFSDKEVLSEQPATQPKFHLTECKTIENMRDKGRFDRYVSSNRRDGLFQVRPYEFDKKIRGAEMEANLTPCKNCLMSLNYNGYAQQDIYSMKEKIFSNFSLKNFFKDFESVFRCLPLYTVETFPEGNYTKDWACRSHEARRKANWTCSCCGICCVEQTGLLHVHHKDGNRGNNRPSNLEVLCLACHKSRPFHGRMAYSPQKKLKLEQLRISQKLPRLCDSCNL